MVDVRSEIYSASAADLDCGMTTMFYFSNKNNSNKILDL